MTLTTYLDYHRWALDRLLKNLEALDDLSYGKELPLALKSIHKTLVHVAYYTHKPFNRLQDAAALTRQEVEQSLHEGSQYLLSLSSEKRVGMEEVLWQIILHNIYHYGQINALLSFENIAIDSLDIFVFLDVRKEMQKTA